MSNVCDYVKWRGDLELKDFEFNEIDNLILTRLAYFPFEMLINKGEEISITELSQRFKRADKTKIKVLWPEDNKLIPLLGNSERFGKIIATNFVNKINREQEKQFSAITLLLPDNTIFVSYRGTDDTLIGWKEDFNMAFTIPVPSQLEGVGYINKISKLIPHDFYVGGHSKGGNIAVYASMHCDFEASPRIKKIFSHDGPGFREEVIKSDAFIKIQDKISKTLPYSSLIGMLLENHEDYHVIKSNKIGGIGQHDPFSWEIKDSDFVYLEKISHGSKYTCDTLHQWLKDIDDKKRKLFIDGLFDIFTCTKSESFIEIFHDWKKNLPLIWDSAKHVDKEIKTMIFELFKELSTFNFKTFSHNDK